MRKCTSRYFIIFGLITIGMTVVIILQNQQINYSSSQNKQTTKKVEITETYTTVEVLVQSGPPSCRGLFWGIASSAVLCHKERAKYKIQNTPIGGYFACSSLVLYVIRIVGFHGSISRSKAPSRGLWMPELVLYGIRLLAKEFLWAVFDIEVDQSG